MTETIFNHRSIRKFRPESIDDNVLKEIIGAGIRASNTGNMQIYSVIVTKDDKIKRGLWEIHFKQNMVLQAPVHITFCVDVNRFHRWCVLNNTVEAYGNLLWFVNGVIDSSLVAQNVCVEAESRGLGICFLGTVLYNIDKVIDILELPTGVIPVSAVVVGYPDENPELTDRLPYSAVVYNEKYDNCADNVIVNCFKEKEANPVYKKIVADNGVANLATVFTEKRYRRSDNIAISKRLLDVLKRQGFFNHDL